MKVTREDRIRILHELADTAIDFIEKHPTALEQDTSPHRLLIYALETFEEIDVLAARLVTASGIDLQACYDKYKARQN